MKNKLKASINCVKTYPQCVEWNLADIPCLGIKTGDTLDDITFAIVRKICEIAGDDLSSISLTCLIEKLGTVEPLNKTISTFLQLVIDNECKLADLIIAIENRIDDIENPLLILDLKCLAVKDSFGNVLPYNTQSVLQNLLTEACLIRGQIAGIGGEITDLNTRIDNLPPRYTEPLLSSCIFSNKPSSQALTLLASDYCTFKTAVGSAGNIQTAIGRECSTLNAEFIADANFIQNPVNLAETVNNLWIVLCKRTLQVAALEACACKSSCKDIVIGFTTTFSDENTVVLNFTSGSGANIPIDFVDCGSTVTIKNDNGVTTGAIPIIISQEGSTIEIDVSQFNGGEYLTFDIDAHLCSPILTCSKCYTKVVRNTAGGCCAITNTDIQDVTIIYTICGIPANLT